MCITLVAKERLVSQNHQKVRRLCARCGEGAIGKQKPLKRGDGPGCGERSVRKSKSSKTRASGRSKFTCGARAIQKPKSLKSGCARFCEVSKICPPLWRDSAREMKAAKLSRPKNAERLKLRQ